MPAPPKRKTRPGTPGPRTTRDQACVTTTRRPPPQPRRPCATKQRRHRRPCAGQCGPRFTPWALMPGCGSRRRLVRSAELFNGGGRTRPLAAGVPRRNGATPIPAARFVTTDADDDEVESADGRRGSVMSGRRRNLHAMLADAGLVISAGKMSPPVVGPAGHDPVGGPAGDGLRTGQWPGDRRAHACSMWVLSTCT